MLCRCFLQILYTLLIWKAIFRHFWWREFNPEVGVVVAWELAGRGSGGSQIKDQNQHRDLKVRPEPEPETRVHVPLQTDTEYCVTSPSLKVSQQLP